MEQTAIARRFLILGTVMAFVSVALGAFGAHAVRDRISPAMLDVYKTGVQYHQIHALALVLVGLVARGQSSPSRLLNVAGWLFVTGILIFGGTLYTLALTGARWLGAVTPLGGLCFLCGWVCLAVAVWRLSPRENR